MLAEGAGLTGSLMFLILCVGRIEMKIFDRIPEFEQGILADMTEPFVEICQRHLLWHDASEQYSGISIVSQRSFFLAPNAKSIPDGTLNSEVSVHHNTSILHVHIIQSHQGEGVERH